MNLFDILAYLYTGKLLKECFKGIHRAYRVQHEPLQSVRGRIDLVETAKKAYTKTTAISCIYDDFHSDTPLNRILKAALRRIIRLARHTEIRTRASQALCHLDEVMDVDVRRLRQEDILFDRRNDRFQACWRLAQLILSQSAPSFSAGNMKSSSILFKMNDLFERYIAYLSKRLFRQVVSQDRSYKLLINEGTERGTFQLQPDLLIQDEHQTPVLMDTKWKRIDSSYHRHGVQREDFYQMYAYLTRYPDVNTVILLYPHHDGIAQSSGVCLESWHLEENRNQRIKVYTVDYEDESKALRELTWMVSESLL